MRIVINDANILIDLADLNLLNDFIKLDFEFHTNNLIIDEITNPEHKKKVNKIININKLLVSTVKSNEYKAILKLQSKNLSSPDCSILYHKKKTNGILLTGDGSLRKTAIKHNIAVKGIFLIFDELVKSNTIDKQTAFEKLKLLQSINKRLPQNEIKNRLNLWEKGQTNQ